MLSDTYDDNGISEKPVVSCLIASKEVILALKAGILVGERKFPQIQNRRHFLMRTRAKAKKNWHDNWE